jgi:ATP synthase protein I
VTLHHDAAGSGAIDPDARNMWRQAARFSAVGIEMGVCTAIGYLGGAWLDRRFGSSPFLMLLCLLLGIAAGFRSLIRAAKAARPR